MDSALVALITAGGGAAVAALTFLLNASRERRDRLQQRKLERYSELLSTISDLAVKGLDPDTHRRYAMAVNTIGLTAPQSLIESLFRFHDEIQVSNPRRTQAQHDHLLTELVLEMRRSLELPFDDDPKTFQFRLVGGFFQPSSFAATDTGAGVRRPALEHAGPKGDGP